MEYKNQRQSTNSKGFLKLSRDKKDHWLFSNPEKLGAWIMLLMWARHTDGQRLLGNTVVNVPRGSLLTSERELADKLGWSRGKVRSFLRTLEENQEITRKIHHKKTTITICNYEEWQGIENHKPPCNHTATLPVTNHESDHNPTSRQTTDIEKSDEFQLVNTTEESKKERKKILLKTLTCFN